MKRDDDELCMSTFARRKRRWILLAVPTALILLVSIFATARGQSTLALQLGALAVLAALALATAVLCRCPRCRRFVYDRKSMAPGWTLASCPHCEAPLNRR